MIKDLGGQFPTLISPRDLGEITSVCWETATLPQAANIFAQVKSRSETSPLFKIFKKTLVRRKLKLASGRHSFPFHANIHNISLCN